ncbi:hypothetical protein GCM10007863_34230 [Dyella mobilis]|nr:hypothetical protein GCM10007863_34230 [Dyella mobilis]
MEFNRGNVYAEMKEVRVGRLMIYCGLAKVLLSRFLHIYWLCFEVMFGDDPLRARPRERGLPIGRRSGADDDAIHFIEADLERDFTTH